MLNFSLLHSKGHQIIHKIPPYLHRLLPSSKPRQRIRGTPVNFFKANLPHSPHNINPNRQKKSQPTQNILLPAAEMKRFGQGSRQHAFQIAVSLVVIGLTAADDLQRFLAAIHMRDFAVDRLAGQLLVRQEVMPQAIDDAGRQFADVVPLAIHLVFGQHGDDFVVGLTAVNHAEAADGRSIHDDVAVCDLAFGEYTNIEWVVVAYDVGSAGSLHA